MSAEEKPLRLSAKQKDAILALGARWGFHPDEELEPGDASRWTLDDEERSRIGPVLTALVRKGALIKPRRGYYLRGPNWDAAMKTARGF
ncbi:MAG: hypothetical protein GY871_04670 [Actinomycetales bacterium]|nr:hypothetical protein [Actinomycetales bacterium]